MEFTEEEKELLIKALQNHFAYLADVRMNVVQLEEKTGVNYGNAFVEYLDIEDIKTQNLLRKLGAY